MITYVLKLEQDKYYIGKTSNLDHRLENHFNGKGSEATKKYPPIECIRTYEGDREKECTLYARKKYGKSNVFGYCYTQTK